MKIHKKKVITDSIFLSSGALILRLKAIIFIPIIIAYVGLANYGAFVQILVNVSLIVPFCTFELGMGFYRYTSKYEESEVEKLSKDYWTVLTAVFIFSVLGGMFNYLISPAISKYILSGYSLKSLRLSSLIVICEGLNSVNVKFIQSRKKFKLFSIYDLLYQLLPYLGFIAGILIKSEIFIGLLIYIIVQAVLMLSLKIYVISGLHFSLPSKKIFIRFLKYSWPLLFTVLSGGFLSKIDRYFIGFYLGPESIGIYNIVYSVCGLLIVFTIPFRKYFATYLPKIWDEGKKDRVREQLKEGLVYYLVISFGAFMGIIFLLRPVLDLILTKKIPQIENFELLIFVTGLGILGLGVVEFFRRLIELREQNYLQLIFQLIAVVLNIILNYFLVKSYGIIGASIATFLSYFVVVILCNFYLDMNLDYSFLTKLIRIVVASLPISLWLYFHDSKNIYNLAVNIVIGALIYMLSILMLRIVKLKDIKKRLEN